MYCRQCGNEEPQGMKFCTRCGAPMQDNNQQVNNYQTQGYPNQYQSYSEPAQPAYQPVNDTASKLQTEIMVMGIMGLAFATSFFLSVLGIVFSSIAKNKANQYINLRGQLEGRAKVGFNLANPGLIVGIVFTALSAIYYMVIFFGVMEELL